MTFRHFKVFSEVYQTLSMSQAAERLNMTQPGVSRTIQELEEYYGSELFLRKNRRLYPTEKARQVFPEVVKCLLSFQNVEQKLQAGSALVTMELGTTSANSLFLAEVIEKLTARLPHCRFLVTEGTSAEIRAMVLDGKLALGLIHDSKYSELLNHQDLFRDEVICVRSPGFTMKTEKEVLGVEDLAQENLILMKQGTGLRAAIDLCATRKSLTLYPFWSCSSVSNAKEICGRGLGIAALNRASVLKELEEGTFLEVKSNLEAFNVTTLIWRVDKKLSEEEQLFRESLVL